MTRPPILAVASTAKGFRPPISASRAKPPIRWIPGTTLLTVKATGAVGYSWLLRTSPPIPRSLQCWAISRASPRRSTFESGSKWTWISTAPSSNRSTLLTAAAPSSVLEGDGTRRLGCQQRDSPGRRGGVSGMGDPTEIGDETANYWASQPLTSVKHRLCTIEAYCSAIDAAIVTMRVARLFGRQRRG